MSLYGLKNVVLSEDAQKRVLKPTVDGHKTDVRVNRQIDPVIKELAILKPTWKFVAHQISAQGVDENGVYRFVASKFAVEEDGEYLGYIDTEYVGRDYKILVHNNRIMAGRERGRGYTTDDSKKAITKRMFGRKSVKERIDQAAVQAENYVSRAQSRHSNMHNDALGVVERAAKEYVMGPGLDAFLKYVQETMPAHQSDRIMQSKQKADATLAEMMVLGNIRSKLGTKHSALVVRDMDQYIVRVGDNVQLYDDNTLPPQLRGGLGMLKLVEKEHFVEGSGCRVSDDVFVVVLSEELDTNKVSQGEDE
jgi:hypothetical protein